MLILALDTTSRAGSLAIGRNGRLLHEMTGDPSVTHGQRLPLDFKRICDAAEVSLADVDLLAVAAGPGSFTGLRVGIAAIQGLAVAFDRRVVPVSTLEAVAAAAPAGVGDVAAWVDAQRGEVFAQIWPKDPRAGITPPSVGSPEAILDAWRSDRSLEQLAFHGDGAVRYADRIRAAVGAGARIGASAPTLAGVIARIAQAAPERAVAPHGIVPIYVRRPDAELARTRRRAQ